MKQLLMSALLLGATFSLASASGAESAVWDEAMNLLDKVDAKAATPQLREAFKTLVMTGELTCEGMPDKASLEEIHVGAERARIDIRFESMGTQTQGTTGDFSWTTDAAMGVVIKKGQDQASVKRLFGIARLKPWRSLYARVESMGDVDLEGKAHMKIRMVAEVPEGCADEADIWYVDKSEHVLRRVDLNLPDLIDGGQIPMQYWFDDWKDVDGYRLPHRKTQRVGEMKIDTIYTKIEVNGAVSPERVAPPDDVVEAMKDPSKSSGINSSAPGEFKIVEVKKIHVASVRMMVKESEISQSLATMLPEVMMHIHKTGAVMAGAPFSRYHGRENGEVDLEAGIPVREAIEPGGRVKASSLPGGRAVSTWHSGSYATLPKTYALLKTWIDEQGLKFRGGYWEVYWTDPGIEPDPKNWKTELLGPIE